MWLLSDKLMLAVWRHRTGHANVTPPRPARRVYRAQRVTARLGQDIRLFREVETVILTEALDAVVVDLDGIHRVEVRR